MRRLLPYLLVFLLALFVRGWHLASIRELPIFEHPVGDARSYDAWGQRIAAGDWFGSEVFYQAPLYPYFLGTFYAIAGRDLLGVRVVQAVLGAMAAVLLALAGSEFLRDRRAGVAAGLLAALHPMALFFDGRIEKSSLDFFLLSAFLCLLARARRGVRARVWVATGSALGLVCLTRENAIVLVPVLAFWLLASIRSEGRRAAIALVALVLGLALPLAPVAWRNHRIAGEVHLMTSQLGPNLYIGNHRGASGTYEPVVPGGSNASYERSDATRVAEDQVGRPLTPAEVSSWWTGRVLDYVRAEPLDWLALLGRKAALLASATEAVDTIDPYTVAGSSLPLAWAVAVLHFGVLAPLALYGVAAAWPDRSRLGILHALAAVYAASVVAFFVLDRYRHPLVPFLVLFAGAGLVRWIDLARRRDRVLVRDRVGVVLALALAALSNRWADPVLDRDRMATVTRTNYGVVHAEAGRPGEAAGEFRRALEIDPANAQAHYLLGICHEELGEPAVALVHYEAAVRIAPGHAQARYNLAVRLEAAGRTEEALRHYRSATRRRPWDLRAGANHARLLALSGRTDEAVAEYRRLLTVDAGAAALRRSLAVILVEAGRADEAIAEIDLLLAADPDDWASWVALGEARVVLGERERALEALERARRLAPAPEGSAIEARISGLR